MCTGIGRKPSWPNHSADLDAGGRPKILAHKEWFDPKDEPYVNERSAYQSLVWQCRYSGIEVPDSLWSYAEIGVGKLYADTQADSLENEPAALGACPSSGGIFETNLIPFAA